MPTIVEITELFKCIIKIFINFDFNAIMLKTQNMLLNNICKCILEL